MNVERMGVRMKERKRDIWVGKTSKWSVDRSPTHKILNMLLVTVQTPFMT